MKKKTFCGARNNNSIGIELCERKFDNKSRSVHDLDWYFAQDTLENASNLVAELMVQYSIPIENLVRHFDVTRKLCPRPFVGDDINVVTHISGNEAWEKFRRDVLHKIDVIENERVCAKGRK